MINKIYYNPFLMIQIFHPIHFHESSRESVNSLYLVNSFTLKKVFNSIYFLMVWFCSVMSHDNLKKNLETPKKNKKGGSLGHTPNSNSCICIFCCEMG